MNKESLKHLRTFRLGYISTIAEGVMTLVIWGQFQNIPGLIAMAIVGAIMAGLTANEAYELYGKGDKK